MVFRQDDTSAIYIYHLHPITAQGTHLCHASDREEILFSFDSLMIDNKVRGMKDTCRG